MARASEAEEPKQRPAHAAVRRNRFVGGDYNLQPFGMITDQEHYKQGYVAADDVRALLDELGLHERKNIEFPFHHMGRKGYESWSLRIEQEHSHQAEGKIVRAHHWVYKREQPETVAGSN